MKTILRNLVLACIILLLLAPALPAQPALAAGRHEKAEITLTAYNHTNGTISIRLANGSEGTYWVSLDAGAIKQVSLPEGRYEYYASTPCGGQSGEFNLNVSKKLNIECKDGLEVTLYKKHCEKVLWVGASWQWYELNPEWWPTLLGDPWYEAEMRCLDGNLPSHFEPYYGPI